MLYSCQNLSSQDRINDLSKYNLLSNVDSIITMIYHINDDNKKDLIYSQILKFNDLGNTIEKKDTYGNGEDASSTLIKYRYDKYNRIKKAKVYRIYTERKEVYKLFKGKSSKTTISKNIVKEPTSIMSYKYDDKNNLISVLTNMTETEQPISRDDYSYDDKNNLISTNSYSLETCEEELLYTIENKYDNESNLIYNISRNISEGTKTETFYKYDGKKLISSEHIDEKGNKSLMKYNDRKLSYEALEYSQENLVNTLKSEFEYDEKSNWIKSSTKDSKGKIIEIIERKITYFKVN